MGSAFRADEFLFRRDRDRRGQIMSVGTAVGGEAGIHQPQTVQQFCAGSECRTNAAAARPLMERQCRRDIQDLIYIGFSCLGHPPPRIGRKGFQIPARTFRIQDAQRQGRFSGPGDTGDSDDFIQGNININIFQVMHPRATDQNLFR